jgi:hypothetical protein
MTNSWITTGSTNLEAVVNPINAACESGFVPDRLYVMENPGTTEVVDDALEVATATITAYGGDEPEIEFTTIDDEIEFERIHDHIHDAITETHEESGEAAVDITPGRKFMSAISFTAGMRYDADHVFYLYVTSNDHYGQVYPDMPRTATHLFDFQEEL